MIPAPQAALRLLCLCHIPFAQLFQRPVPLDILASIVLLASYQPNAQDLAHPDTLDQRNIVTLQGGFAASS